MFLRTVFLIGAATLTSAFAAPITPADHRCGTAGMSPSAVPANAPAGTTFPDLANPVAACCTLGWAQGAIPTDSSYKLDCIEAVPSADFLSFYNYSGGNPDVDAGVSRPNRFFGTVAGGSPLPGFYDQRGMRCPYLDPGTRAPISLTVTQQFDLFDQAIAARTIPNASPVARLGDECTNLVLLALERRCPVDNPSNGRIWRTAPPDSTGVRCTAAASMRVHFYVLDLSTSARTQRAKFRPATSVLTEAGGDILPVEEVLYPLLLPRVFTVPPCPEGFILDTAGFCQIDPI